MAWAPHATEKARAYPCPVCGKEFKAKDYLTQHLRSKGRGGTGRHQNQKRKQKGLKELAESEVAGTRYRNQDEGLGVVQAQNVWTPGLMTLMHQ